jgi:nucleoside-diphosphate-sugar epimerase
VPPSLVGAAGATSEWLTRAVGRTTIFNREKVRELLAPGWLCETDAARTELGFVPRFGLPEGLAETARWYRAHGWL